MEYLVYAIYNRQNDKIYIGQITFLMFRGSSPPAGGGGATFKIYGIPGLRDL